ncbi:hypothetical protein Golob_009461, partial [Gossypium lobatum]|nr:hypothetical protein [Gossypium lobatum]
MREEAIAMASTSPLSISSPEAPMDIAAAKLILFAPRLPADYADWLGEIKLLSYFRINILSMLSCSLCQSDLELTLIQVANDVSSEAHVEVIRKTKAGKKEYQFESMFQSHLRVHTRAFAVDVKIGDLPFKLNIRERKSKIAIVVREF